MKISAKPETQPHLDPIRSAKRYCSYTLLVIEKPQKTTNNWLPNILKRYATEYNAYNVVAMFQYLNQTIELATYLPFTNEMIRLPVTAFTQDELFRDKVNDFHGKPFNVAIFPEEVRAVRDTWEQFHHGTDFEMAKILAADLNATLQLHGPPDNEEYGNPVSQTNGTGTLGQVMRGEVDISINSRFLRLDLFQNINLVEATIPIGRDDMCVLVPVLSYRSNFEHLIHSMDAWSWILIFVIIFPIRNFIRFAAQSRDPNYLHFSYIDTVRSYLNQMISMRRLPQSMALRFVVVAWLIYCFVMMNIFQCCFTSTFTVKWLQNPIEIRSIKDLTGSNVRVMAAIDYDRLIRKYFNETDDNIQDKLLMKMRSVNWTVYNRHLNDNDTSYAYANKNHLTNYYANLKHQNGIQLFHGMSECLIPFLCCYIVPFGSPLLDRINVIIVRLLHSGIFQYWEKQANAESIQKHFIRFNNEPEPIRIENLAFAFYILFGGLLIAFLRLMYELRDFNYNRKCIF